MTARDDHDPIAERTSLRCYLRRGSRPEDNPDGDVSETGSRIAERLSVGSWQFHGTLPHIGASFAAARHQFPPG
jgi:hypothetical protein